MAVATTVIGEGGAEERFLGRWKSGRPWKSACKKFGASEKVQIEGSARKKSWRLKVEERQRMALEREMVHTLVERKQQQKELARKNRNDARLRREENTKRSEVVQRVTNIHKLKRMTKAQKTKLRVQK